MVALNRALLLTYYGLEAWPLRPGYLCPPVPGRAEYVHHVADLLADGSSVPRGPEVSILDIGTGASAVYPIIGIAEYGWRFVGTELDEGAWQSASSIVAMNGALRDHVEIRRQENRECILVNIVRDGDRFDACICNPPFHSSAEQAADDALRKEALMGSAPADVPVRHFGGLPHELWCEGGEAWFVGRLIAESAMHPRLCRWFTSYVSSRHNLPALRRDLAMVGATEVREIEIAYRAKKARILAWRFGAGQ